jgi:ATP-dependent exoDNAse (exonuclease V) alpha subunit
MTYIETINYIIGGYIPVFLIHGPAGSGKSWFLRMLARAMCGCLKMAPTGLSAYNIDGVTVDSLLSCYNSNPETTLRDIGRRYSCIIVDEISMVPYFKIDELFSIIEKLPKQEHDQPLKLVMIGDPHQLPPVTTDDMIEAYSRKEGRQLEKDDFYFFKSKKFREYYVENKIACYYLTNNYRQKDDRNYAETLNKIAVGEIDRKSLDYLNQQIMSTGDLLQESIPPIIAPTKKAVSFFNKIMLGNSAQVFSNAISWILKPECIDNIKIDYSDITESVQYRIDAPIIFIQNDKNGEWVNGTSGVIKNIDAKGIISILTDRNVIVECEPTKHLLSRLVYNKDSDKVETKYVAIAKQLPFVLGYAMTIHRCQGMTLDHMTLNSANGLFAPGQLYVALSRLKSLQGLHLHVKIDESDIITAPSVNKYFDAFMKRCVKISKYL